MQSKYVYPAVFTKEGEQYSVAFPDIGGCYTCGDSLVEAVSNAQDALCLMLYDMEESGEVIPAPSDALEIEKTLGNNEFISLVSCDTLEYRQYFDQKAVKKTLTIPSWLNTLAEKEGINFSSVLQAALKRTLGIESNVARG